MNNKRVVYEGIRISVQALTLFIAIGLLTLGLLIWYAAAQGNVFEDGAPAPAEQMAEPTVVPTAHRGKINQRFIDKRELRYYNKSIAVAAKTP